MRRYEKNDGHGGNQGNYVDHPKPLQVVVERAIGSTGKQQQEHRNEPNGTQEEDWNLCCEAEAEYGDGETGRQQEAQPRFTPPCATYGGPRVHATKQETNHGAGNQDQQERLLELGRLALHGQCRSLAFNSQKNRRLS